MSQYTSETSVTSDQQNPKNKNHSSSPAIAILVTLMISSGFTAALMKNTLAHLNPDAVLPNGMRYIGNVENGLLQGEGELIGAGRERYKGSFMKGLLDGPGEYWDAEGGHYQGNFVQGVMHGQGTYTYVDGSVYEGEFYRGEVKGAGKMYFLMNESYEGEFAQGLFHGEGKYTDRWGNTYAGHFEKHQIVQGTLESFDTRYEGAFKDWLFHGKGIYTDYEGNEFSGTFEQGALTGKGRIKGSDGSSYEGELEGFIKQGNGRFVDAEGNIYTGEFEYGEFEGEGTLVLAEPVGDIKVVSGEWSWGELKNDPRKPADFDRKQVETLLYSQNDLIETSLQNIAENDPNKIELFYLGVAGYGTQDVFLKEIKFIEDQFQTEPYAPNRMASLVNHYDTFSSRPLATFTSLRKMVKGFEEKMDVDNDILFVYLTSHGSKDHQFSIRMKGLNLPSITAEQFAEVFNESAIRWKIIVISACYSGGYIPSLQNKNTLVMTAARHDRTSFGCGDESEMTYFGRAFFKESLPLTQSFVEAFDMARGLVSVWEAFNFTITSSSEPQIAKGGEILLHLKKWRSQAQEGLIKSGELGLAPEINSR